MEKTKIRCNNCIHFVRIGNSNGILEELRMQFRGVGWCTASRDPMSYKYYYRLRECDKFKECLRPKFWIEDKELEQISDRAFFSRELAESWRKYDKTTRKKQRV